MSGLTRARPPSLPLRFCLIIRRWVRPPRWEPERTWHTRTPGHLESLCLCRFCLHQNFSQCGHASGNLPHSRTNDRYTSLGQLTRLISPGFWPHVGSRTRCFRRSILARPYLWRLSILSRLIRSGDGAWVARKRLAYLATVAYWPRKPGNPWKSHSS